MEAASSGQSTQVATMRLSWLRSVADPLNQFQPTIAPTTAWVEDTGRPARVIQATVRAAARAVVKEPARAFTAPSWLRPSLAPAPALTAPSTTKMLQRKAAVEKRSMRLPTAEPKTLAASLPPSDQPRNRPLERNSRPVASTTAPA